MGPPVVVGLSVSSPGRVGEGLVEHRYREGRLMVPAGLEGIVLAALGLDNRPQASPHFRLSKEAAAPSSYTPLQVAQAYQFPAGTDGTGQTIAILEFGGGFPASDLQSYCSGLGLPVLSVKAAGVDGASNAPGSDPSGADGEVLLDIEVAGRWPPARHRWCTSGPTPTRLSSTRSGGWGVPDVAGNADPQTGYQVLVDGNQAVIGGTSAVAPLWAGLIARLAQATGQKFGLLQPVLYSGVTPGTDVAGFNDITSGNNGAYAAGPRLGRLHGTRLPVRHRPAGEVARLDRRRRAILPPVGGAWSRARTTSPAVSGPRPCQGRRTRVLSRVARIDPVRMSTNEPTSATPPPAAPPAGPARPRPAARPGTRAKQRGKQPKLSTRQQHELVRKYGAGEYTIADLTKVFTVSRTTVYRTLQRASTSKAVKIADWPPCGLKPLDDRALRSFDERRRLCAAATERCPGGGSDDAVDGQVALALKLLHGRFGHRPENAVDLLVAQGPADGDE